MLEQGLKAKETSTWLGWIWWGWAGCSREKDRTGRGVKVYDGMMCAGNSKSTMNGNERRNLGDCGESHQRTPGRWARRRP